MEYSKETVQQVWEKARGMPGKDPNEWRQDGCGAWIAHGQFGSATSAFGWKIENVTPGNRDELEDLRPFHRDNDFDRALGKPHCQIVADRDATQPTASIGAPRNKMPG